MAPPDGHQQPRREDTPGLRSDRVPLIAFVQDAETEAVLRDVLLSAAGEGAIIQRGDLAAPRRMLARMPTPATLLVDVAGKDGALVALDDLAQHVEPGVRVLAVGDRQDVDFYRQLTRGLGITEYLYKPLNRELVARVFVPVVSGRTSSEISLRGGRMIAVSGVRGGVGATCIAVNLAVHLAERSRHHTLLLDGDLHTGTAALMLAAEAGKGLRAALEYPERVDELFLERSAPLVGDRLHVLAAEEPLDATVAVAEGAPHRLADVVRRRYNFTIADVPRGPLALSRELLHLAHQRVLVMDASLAAVRDALRHLALPLGPHQPRRPVVVLNRLGAPGALSVKQITDALEHKPEVVIPWLPRQLPTAATLGEPAARRRGPFQAAIATLADEVVAQPGTGTGRKRGLFGRLFAA